MFSLAQIENMPACVQREGKSAARLGIRCDGDIFHYPQTALMKYQIFTLNNVSHV